VVSESPGRNESERRCSLEKKGRQERMTRPLVGLQDLRRRTYAKAKAEVSWRFWGLYVHVCKEETLLEAT
jgi:RNA-directed DNA polymerase